MQQSGTLKKRKRRNLAKVNGLSTLLYDEAADNYDGTTVFSPFQSDSNTFLQRSADTQIRMSDLLQNSSARNSSKSNMRVTRNPIFHMEDDDDAADDNIGRSIPPSIPDSYEGHGSIMDRPYFLDKSTMTRFRQILLLGMFSGTFPWIWNAKKHRVDKWKPFWEKVWNLIFLLMMIQTSFITIFQCYPMYKGITGKQATYRELFMGSLNVFVYSSTVAFNITMYLYQEQIRMYINLLFELNREFMDKYVVDLEGYKDGGRLVINLSIPSNMSQVIASIARFLVMPFQPWYLFSYIYPKPWYWLIPGAIQEFIVIGQNITCYVFVQWVIVAHANSMEFWLRESHRNNDSGYTTTQFRNPKKAVEKYRTLQIVGNRFNDCMAPMVVPLMKMYILLGIIPCGFVFLRSINHFFLEEFPAILSFPIGFIDVSTTGFCTMTVAATVFDLAGGFIDSWSRTKHKGFRRILMSCPTLKVRVGHFYFVTVSTTITFFKVVADYIIDCIITFK